MPNLGMGELLIILIICLLVFGAGRLPQIGDGIGKAVRNLKRGLNTDDDIEVTSRDRQVPDRSSASSAREEIDEAKVEKRG